ncbi:dihydrodipicolinate reductase [Oryzisolibacter propanilivorax]|uniref:4-hydroxy-tetrahydrodipicolinate reductase n=1 Tax=Oryzisolibacter propanilivorax TaxID=1527607 RepID=A0A1G9Q4Q0_9BURK|nr:4-hydroxy-tetrahydrodipicolinate reductase [Oryzisolibacter propanilivorax]SDM06024.1 dihydrodipicolinate reductase [Oryzisolibacter propanilivorax]
MTAAAAPASTTSRRRVAVAGATGRMGRMLIEAIAASDDLVLAGALDLPGSPGLGQDAMAFLGRASGVAITDDLRAGLGGADALIDFTRPEGTLAHAAVCADAGVQLVIGTTGFSEAQKAQLQALSQRVAMVLAPNMGVGVNVTLKLLQLAARSLQGWDIEIVEAHHKHKVDAPSGTALKMGEVIAEAQGTRLADRAVYERYGHTGERRADSIGFATVRGGDIVGDHTVLFAGTGERVEITHKSSSRAGYAEGSLRAVRFLAGRPSGLFDMFDVLGLQG